jgi:hypothetical protein
MKYSSSNSKGIDADNNKATMDRQNRVGSKFGGGGVSSAGQTGRERKERLKQLALESIDLAKDPYLVRNHLCGSYECESNYLAHTQGKKHQQGLARRAHHEKLAAHQQEQQSGTIAPSSVPFALGVRRIKYSKVEMLRPINAVCPLNCITLNSMWIGFNRVIVSCVPLPWHRRLRSWWAKPSLCAAARQTQQQAVRSVHPIAYR